MTCGSSRCPSPDLEPGDVLYRGRTRRWCAAPTLRIYQGRKQKNVTFYEVAGPPGDVAQRNTGGRADSDNAGPTAGQADRRRCAEPELSYLHG